MTTTDTPGSSPAQTDDSALHKRGRSADVDEQSSPRRAKKPKPAGTNSTFLLLQGSMHYLACLSQASIGVVVAHCFNVSHRTCSLLGAANGPSPPQTASAHSPSTGRGSRPYRSKCSLLESIHAKIRGGRCLMTKAVLMLE